MDHNSAIRLPVTVQAAQPMIDMSTDADGALDVSNCAISFADGVPFGEGSVLVPAELAETFLDGVESGTRMLGTIAFDQAGRSSFVSLN